MFDLNYRWEDEAFFACVLQKDWKLYGFTCSKPSNVWWPAKLKTAFQDLLKRYNTSLIWIILVLRGSVRVIFKSVIFLCTSWVRLLVYLLGFIWIWTQCLGGRCIQVQVLIVGSISLLSLPPAWSWWFIPDGLALGSSTTGSLIISDELRVCM